MQPDLSVILPVYNEALSVGLMFERLQKALEGINYEIIVVNDGSTDHSWAELVKVAANNPQIKLLNFRRNTGQTAAINAGIQHSS